MAEITFKGNTVKTIGNLPEVGSKAKDFTLVGTDLKEATLATFAGKKKIVNIYPSVDTGICAASVRAFQKKLAGRADVVVIHVAADLPFAFKRFCGAEGIENAVGLSTFRSDFADAWGVRMLDGALQGLCSRAVVVLDENNTVKYTEQVPEIAQEPDYEKAAAAL
jgi:thiol peroxidase